MNGKGSILITSLWIMAILSLMAMGIGFRASLETRLNKYSMDRLRAGYFASAGVEKAKALLRGDTNEYDTLYECGTSLRAGETPEQIFNAEFDKWGGFSVYYTYQRTDGSGEAVRYGMTDEERKININMDIGTADGKNEFARMLKGLSPKVTDEIISNIIDWRDADSLGSAEEAYYGNLEYPYGCKNADFEFIEELLLVKGVTGALFDEIKDYITVFGSGKINVNTASEKVLNAVISAGFGAYETIAGVIVEARKGPDGKEGPGDGWADMQNCVDSLPLTNMDVNRLNELNSKGRFTFKSENFRIISHGSVRRVKKTITCVVKKEGGELLYYHRE